MVTPAHLAHTITPTRSTAQTPHPRTAPARPTPPPPTTADADFALAHRRVLNAAPEEDLFDRVRACFATWAATRLNGPVPLSSGIHEPRPGVRLAVASRFDADGAETLLQLQLTETGTPSGHWRTTISAHRDAAPAALVGLDLEHASASGTATATPDPPRLIRDLLDELDIRDGPTALTRNPLAVPADRVEPLLHLLTAPHRRLPVIVAARPLQRDTRWSKRMHRITAQAAGAAALYLLDDPARQQLNSLLASRHHRIAPGAVRTYLPEVDPAWPADGPRHRILSAARLCDPSDRAWRLVAADVNDRARSAPLPRALQASGLLSEQQRTARKQRAQTVDPDDPRMAEEVALLTALLSEADAENAALSAQLQGAERQLHATKTTLEEERAAHESDLLDHHDTLDELSSVQDQLADAWQLLGRHAAASDHSGAAAAADSATEPQEPPATFEDLLARLGELSDVVFTGDTRATLELDTVSGGKGAVWASKAWRALVALEDYAVHTRSTGSSGSFWAYCQQPPPGARAISAASLAARETATTMAQWGTERLLPVPEEVAAGGRAEMQAHIKLDSRGSIAPRIYYLDDLARSGRIYVGLIARHPTNTRT